MNRSVGYFCAADPKRRASLSAVHRKIRTSGQAEVQNETLELIDWRREAWKNVTFLSKDCYANAGAVARRRQ
jgi:hypothetical protein